VKPLFKDVDLVAGDDFSAFAGRVCASTFNSCPYATVVDYSKGHFRGPKGVRLNLDEAPWLAGSSITTAPDGIGTKISLSVLAGNYGLIAQDLFAMTGGDVTRWGGKRIWFTNIMDVEKLGQFGDEVRLALQEIMLGLGKVAREQGIIVLNGETAELGRFVGSVDIDIHPKLNWSGVMLGCYHPDYMILGDLMKPGQLVVALKEPRLRSNGFTTVRVILNRQFGRHWWESTDSECRAAIAAAAEPSVLYDSLLEEANGWAGGRRIPIAAIAHISGGGIPTKFGDLLKQSGLSAVLDNLYDPPEIMQKCFTWGALSHEYVCERWNGGQGALAVMEEQYVDSFQTLAAKHGVESKVCGRITKSGRGGPLLQISSKYEGGGVMPFSLK
jgi:phosphoribosylformylglycinamidine cyclo-ligase